MRFFNVFIWLLGLRVGRLFEKTFKSKYIFFGGYILYGIREDIVLVLYDDLVDIIFGKF